MKTNETMIRPFETKVSPFDLAQQFYAEHAELNFWDDLVDHFRNGVVVSQPDCFAMCKIIELSDDPQKSEPAWFIRMVVGPLPILLRKLPFALPKICFCRNNDGRVRVYDLHRIARLASRAFSTYAAQALTGKKVEVS